MYKKFFMGIAAMAALTLVSCSSDDLDSFSDNSSKNEAISFDGYLGRSAVAVNGTRGSVETVDQLKTDGFGVFSTHTGAVSFSDFNNQQVTNKYSKWTYTPIKYWPTTPGNINFLAYAPYDANTVLTGSKINFKVVDEVAKQKDLLWANANAQINDMITSKNNKVTFHFVHALSKLGYTIKLHEKYSSATFTLNKIILAGSPDENTKAFYKEGNIDLSTQKTATTDLWDTSSSEKQNFNWFSGSYENLSTTASNPDTDNNYLFVIPQDFSKVPTEQNKVVDELYVIVQYTITYANNGGAQTNTVYKKLTTNFKQGKAYMLNLTIGLPIEFDATVDNWTDGDKIDDIDSWDGIK